MGGIGAGVGVGFEEAEFKGTEGVEPAVRLRGSRSGRSLGALSSASLLASDATASPPSSRMDLVSGTTEAVSAGVDSTELPNDCAASIAGAGAGAATGAFRGIFSTVFTT